MVKVERRPLRVGVLAPQLSPSRHSGRRARDEPARARRSFHRSELYFLATRRRAVRSFGGAEVQTTAGETTGGIDTLTQGALARCWFRKMSRQPLPYEN